MNEGVTATAVGELRLGDCIGSPTRLLFICVTGVRPAPAAGVEVTVARWPGGIADDAEDRSAQPVFETRNWLRPDAQVAVRPVQH